MKPGQRTMCGINCPLVAKYSTREKQRWAVAEARARAAARCGMRDQCTNGSVESGEIRAHEYRRVDAEEAGVQSAMLGGNWNGRALATPSGIWNGRAGGDAKLQWDWRAGGIATPELEQACEWQFQTWTGLVTEVRVARPMGSRDWRMGGDARRELGRACRRRRW